jgi:RNA recognition motif-containing protein
MSGKRLYVGNISFQCSEADLEDAFSPFGTVENTAVVTDRDTGRSRGFGFVEMGTDAEAEAAVEALNETELGGRRIKVNIARPREERPRRS